MIQTIRTLLTVVAMILLAVPSAGAYSPTTDSYQVSLYKISADEKPQQENPGKRRRGHPAPIPCQISVEEGILIPGIDVSEIVAFELLDADGDCIAAFSSEPDFLDALPLFHGEYRLRFVTNDFDLQGWIYLN